MPCPASSHQCIREGVGCRGARIVRARAAFPGSLEEGTHCGDAGGHDDDVLLDPDIRQPSSEVYRGYPKLTIPRGLKVLDCTMPYIGITWENTLHRTYGD